MLYHSRPVDVGRTIKQPQPERPWPQYIQDRLQAAPATVRAMLGDPLPQRFWASDVRVGAQVWFINPQKPWEVQTGVVTSIIQEPSIDHWDDCLVLGNGGALPTYNLVWVYNGE